MSFPSLLYCFKRPWLFPCHWTLGSDRPKSCRRRHRQRRKCQGWQRRRRHRWGHRVIQSGEGQGHKDHKRPRRTKITNAKGRIRSKNPPSHSCSVTQGNHSVKRWSLLFVSHRVTGHSAKNWVTKWTVRRGSESKFWYVLSQTFCWMSEWWKDVYEMISDLIRSKKPQSHSSPVTLGNHSIKRCLLSSSYKQSDM